MQKSSGGEAQAPGGVLLKFSTLSIPRHPQITCPAKPTYCIQKIRLAKGYSTRVFAYRADIAHSTVEKLEAGEMNPSLIILLKLAEALETDLNTLAGKK
ncbi:helix-turn-helix domain-containing protein [Chitinophaga barathri]|uniref:XRE family transcriptional regulator n=1 Tax=Chitinophaga barathri TaxID=1647451 RepID=A0A3N4M7I0_9BACT|nr:helix-turn-helix transcriptional regulator [Chitinophaga barathri]RPD39454.1 XRE family transcriptional regulator [Chitinophaga barathri]